MTSMPALVYDKTKDVWETSKGLRMEEVPRPSLNAAKDYRDDSKVLLEPLYTGFCGSDRNIWFRRAFKDMIYDSLEREGKNARIIGHEILGRVIEPGKAATREFGLREGDIV